MQRNETLFNSSQREQTISTAEQMLLLVLAVLAACLRECSLCFRFSRPGLMETFKQ